MNPFRTEKNCFGWVEGYLKGKLGELKATDGVFDAYVPSVTVEGEATVGNRKGKMYYIYELTVTAKWKGTREWESMEQRRSQKMKEDNERELFFEGHFSCYFLFRLFRLLC